MATGDSEHGVLVWCDGRRAALTQGVLGRLADLHALAVGGPTRGQIAELAAALGAKLHDDLRKMLIDQPARWLLLATCEGVGAAELKLAAEAGLGILALEPPDAWA